MMTTGEKIAVLRRSTGLSQEALAEELGISRQAVSRWETNESLPDTEKVIRLSRRFHVTTDYLLMEDMQKSDPTPQTSPDLRLLQPLYRAGIGIAAAGTLLTLFGILAATLWAILTHQWVTDYGRIGTALFCKWPGAILFGGIMLLLLALALLGIHALLPKNQS